MVKRLYMRPFSNLEEAFSTALAEKGDHAGVYAMTVGGTTLPEYRGSSWKMKIRRDL